MLTGRTSKRSVKVGAVEGMWWHVANAAMKQLHHLAPAVGDAPAHEMAYSVLTEMRRAQHSSSQVKLKLQAARWQMLQVQAWISATATEMQCRIEGLTDAAPPD